MVPVHVRVRLHGRDFNLLKFVRVEIEGERTVAREIIDHQLTINMAKEIYMIPRTDMGKRCREHILEQERLWNSPEAVFVRELQYPKMRLERIMEQSTHLLETTTV